MITPRLLGILRAVLGASSIALVSVSSSHATAEVDDRLAHLPLYFVENRGQLDGRVAYYVQGIDKTLYFTREGVTFSLTGRRLGASSLRTTVKLDFLGSDPDVHPQAEQPTPAVVSYFKGARDIWRTALKTYSRIVYPDLWPGIDLVYSGEVSRLEYRFIVRPGARPESIRLAYRGASSVALNDAGQIDVATPVESFTDDVPVAWQEIDGTRRPVDVAYALDTSSKRGGRRFGFRVGAYDTTRPLILDPSVIVYCGYIGGGGNDTANGIAVDGSGYAYIVGTTTSNEGSFPVTVGPDLTINDVCCGLEDDAFVAKVKADGTALVYCGYIGSSGNDKGNAIAIDSAGNAYVTGITRNDNGSFPVLVGPYLTPKGSDDVFVTKVNASGTALVYSGLLAGSVDEEGYAIAVDDTGAAYVTGSTSSCDGCFPTGFPLVAPLDGSYNGNGDAFLAKVQPDGAHLVYSTFLGGSGYEQGSAIAVDAAHNVYIAGETGSTQTTFPLAVGPSLIYGGSNRDAFVMKINAAGNAILWSGYIGGSGTDKASGLALGPDGSIYVTGQTGSNQATFPVIGGPSLTFGGASIDGFVAKVKPDGTGLTYCGYLGGNGDDWGSGIAVDAYGRAYVAGGSQSTNWPPIEGRSRNNVGGNDAYVARVNKAGTALEYLSFLGGIAADQANAIALDGDQNAYIAGSTAACDFPVAVGPDLTCNDFAVGDAFVAKIAPGTPTLRLVADGHASWTALTGAVAYDYCYGDLMMLRATGDFFLSTLGCHASNFAGTDLTHPPDPCQPGQGLYYLVRDVRAFPPDPCKGSYGDGSAFQVGVRSPRINASPVSCP